MTTLNNIEIVSDGDDLFVLADGVKIAQARLCPPYKSAAESVRTRSTWQVVSAQRKSSIFVGRVTLSPSMQSAAARRQRVLPSRWPLYY